VVEGGAMTPPTPPRTVLILTATERVSGPLKGILQYVRHLDAQRYRPLLGLLRARVTAPSDAELEAAAQGVPYVVLEQSGSFDWRLFAAARRLVRAREVALVQTHGYKTHLLGLSLRLTLGLPWIGFEHGFTTETWRVRLYHRLAWLLRYADRAVVVSGRLERQLRRMGVSPSRLVRLHNAVEPDEGDAPLVPGAFRQAHRIPPDVPLVAVIGRISSEKGQRVFLDAFRAASAAVPSAHAVLVGEGPDEAFVAERIGRLGLGARVHWIGYQRPVAPIYRDADLVVIPSYTEGIPNVLLEALAVGCPVVSTAVGGVPEVVVDGEQALLVPAGDAPAMGEAIARVLQDKPLRDRLIEAGRERIALHHSPVRRAQRIVGLYDALLG
jgi:glycosyltransferase involved in cell wall biosynthesis